MKITDNFTSKAKDNIERQMPVGTLITLRANGEVYDQWEITGYYEEQGKFSIQLVETTKSAEHCSPIATTWAGMVEYVEDLKQSWERRVKNNPSITPRQFVIEMGGQKFESKFDKSYPFARKIVEA